MAFPELASWGSLAKTWREGQSESHWDPNGRAPQGHTQAPVSPCHSYDSVSENPPNFTKCFLGPRKFNLKGKRSGTGVELGNSHPLPQEQPHFIRHQRRAVPGGCWGLLALACTVSPYGLAPIVVAQRSSLCSHPCQRALWWCQCACQSTSGPCFSGAPERLRKPQNDLKMVKCGRERKG